MQKLEQRELEKAVTEVRQATMGRLVKRHPKYRFWGPLFEHAGPLLLGKTRGKMIEADYLVMRELDDMADGDTPVPKDYNSASQYIEEKISFLRNPNTPRDNADKLLLYCEQLSQQEGLSLTQEREFILRSMLFDAQRFGTYQIFPAAILDEHFYRCDIEGTGKGALKIFGEDPAKYRLVEPLGVVSRIHDNLLDYERDVKAGYINIPEEDINRSGMTLVDIKDVNSPKVGAWFAKELTRARGLLEQDRVLFPQGRFSLLGRIFVELYIRRPAVHYFNNFPS
ncbi:hypothetical protein HYU95_00410 [Candidatus Daviesbacteria bacterium]|nr:hypothetical protein [Candidatus Daviesbacteria bacterium]